ncbi:MAG: class I SAM-dependent methyltransferase, partial [Thermoplasmata archaeon]|nr:class I SAM-dependent methyltransferase [Thermoplasmata archaeon]
QSCARSFPIIDGIPSFVDQDMVINSFDASSFEFLFEMEQKHFWHVGRKEIIYDVLKRNTPHLAELRMLEIGCGNGSVLAYLKEKEVNIEGGDIFIEGLKFCQQRSDPVALYQVDILSLPFRNDFDIIGVFDVLEHIEEDEKALAEISQALKPGGTILITVPAHKLLWSYFDESSNHKRRYSRKEIVTKLERNDFVIKKMSFYMFFLFPLMLSIRMINNTLRRNEAKRNARTSIELKTVPLVNRIFLELLRLEKWLMRYLDLPFGASLMVLAEKR